MGNLLKNIEFKNLFFVYLVYILGVITTLFFMWQFGFITIALIHDSSHFSSLITAVYSIFETICGVKIYRLSKEIIKTRQHLYIMKTLKNFKIYKKREKIYYGDGINEYYLENSFLHDHVITLMEKQAAREFKSKRVDNDVILSNLKSELGEKFNTAYNFTEILVWMGLIGTILGIIITFYPFISGSILVNTSDVQAMLGKIFGGVGSAFFPSITSAVYCLFLKITDGFLQKGSVDLYSAISKGSETIILPHIENNAAIVYAPDDV